MINLRQTSANSNRKSDCRQILKNQILKQFFLFAVFGRESRIAMRRDAVYKKTRTLTSRL